jgi:hypothetical protein
VTTRTASTAAEVSLETDDFFAALCEIVRPGENVNRTATELLSEISPLAPHPRPRSWPDSSRAVATKMRRLAPTLRRLGWEVSDPAKSRKATRRGWVLVRPSESVTLVMSSSAHETNDEHDESGEMI